MRVLLSVLICLFYISANAQNEGTKVEKKTRDILKSRGYYAVAESYEDDRIGVARVQSRASDPVRPGKSYLSWGFVDAKSLSEVIPCQYNSIERFNDGLCVVGVLAPEKPYYARDHFGIIDKQGKTIVAPDSRSGYNWISNRRYNGKYVALKKDIPGFIDGKWQFSPATDKDFPADPLAGCWVSLADDRNHPNAVFFPTAPGKYVRGRDINNLRERDPDAGDVRKTGSREYLYKDRLGREIYRLQGSRLIIDSDHRGGDLRLKSVLTYIRVPMPAYKYSNNTLVPLPCR